MRVEAPGGALLDHVDLTVLPGEVLGVVGESGSGKTTLALALLGETPPGTRATAGRVTVAGTPMLHVTPAERRQHLGRIVAYVPQDPVLALNPAMRVGRQVAEVARAHHDRRDETIDTRAMRALRRAELPGDPSFLRRWPHQISGGQQQRVTLAQAVVNEPRLLVLDEPTTGLDVITQADLLAQLRRLRDEAGCGILYVTHDIAAVAGIADRLAVLYAGRVVEEGPTSTLLSQPRHPYTAALIDAVPDPRRARGSAGLPGVVPPVGARPSGCSFAPRCGLVERLCLDAPPPPAHVGTQHRVACLNSERTGSVVVSAPTVRRVSTPSPRTSPSPANTLLVVEDLHAVHRTRRRQVVAAAGISFSLDRDECVALLGASGSGKSTIARCIVGLHRPTAGTVRLGGTILGRSVRHRRRDQRRRIQLVPQNPADTLDPSRTVGEQVARPARILRRRSARQAVAEAVELLDQVRLPTAVAARRPGELSGGERQRVALARALAARPEVLVCDEITSALDVSVQAVVLDLLADLRTELGLAMVFISHDLGVVASVADRVAVLADGRVCETGPTREVLESPRTPVARQLVHAAPRLPYRDVADATSVS
ncbi:ABC transporter ATP-binding protein [Longimycelium tulufanense]|uniref:ABC transporter ATP-binding protein n=1 Tax=Longimycelium tulufanense TaxID=907463 RepID=A0A8J3FUG9_9PSEU|nr:ABC transporter ATP-binding protein [Longimycelium tulufanense]